MGTIFWWIILTIIVSIIGATRKIGFFLSFIVSLLLSPLIGFIVVLVSKSKSQIAFEQKTIELQKQQLNLLKKLNIGTSTISEQLEILKKQYHKGEISLLEFKAKRSELLKMHNP